MDWHTLQAFAQEHKESLTLFAMAAIVTMRKTLPWPFCKVDALEWSYEWLRDALATLLSLKGPLPHGAEIHTSESVATDGKGATESTKETTATAPIPAASPEPKP